MLFGSGIDIFKCNKQNLLIKYLGLPLGSNPRKAAIWSEILDKIKKTLAHWKRKILSIGGRLTLIKSSMTNLPIYYLELAGGSSRDVL